MNFNKTISIILILFSSSVFRAQNFVPNPSFEDTVFCPTGSGQMTAVQHWDNPVNQQPGSTTDYYNSCGHSGGNVLPHSGNAFAGFISYYTIFTAREYAQVQLTQPLLPNKCYVVEMWARSSASGYLISDLGMLLGDTAIQAPNGTFIGATPQIATTTVLDTASWTLIRDTLSNLGGKQWLTIGVFATDANIAIIQPTGLPSAGGGFYIDDVSITELPVDSLPLSSLNDTTICSGQSLTLTAPNGYGSIHHWSNVLTPGTPLSTTNTLNVSPTVTTTYIYQVHDACADIYFDTVTVTVSPLPSITANASNTSVCSGHQVTLTGSGGTSYTWNNGVTNGVPFTPVVSSNYTVTGTGANGCQGTAQIFITVVAPQQTNGNISICQGDSILINGVYQSVSGTYSDTISGFNSCDSIHTTTLTVSPNYNIDSPISICDGDSILINNIYRNTPGTYTETLSSHLGCDSTVNYILTLSPKPLTATSGNTSLSPGQSVTISAYGGSSYSWYPSTGLSCTSCQSPSASPNESTWYYVIITSSEGCSSLDSLYIEVNPSGNIYVPNVFSPNGDGNNDIFYVQGNGIKHINLMIFNRWGQNIFESNDINRGWDGTSNGKDLNQGVFVYSLKVELYNNRTVQKTGSVTLLK